MNSVAFDGIEPRTQVLSLKFSKSTELKTFKTLFYLIELCL